MVRMRSARWEACQQAGRTSGLGSPPTGEAPEAVVCSTWAAKPATACRRCTAFRSCEDTPPSLSSLQSRYSVRGCSVGRWLLNRRPRCPLHHRQGRVGQRCRRDACSSCLCSSRRCTVAAVYLRVAALAVVESPVAADADVAAPAALWPAERATRRNSSPDAQTVVETGTTRRVEPYWEFN